jgi:hypothetical protein
MMFRAMPHISILQQQSEQQFVLKMKRYEKFIRVRVLWS